MPSLIADYTRITFLVLFPRSSRPMQLISTWIWTTSWRCFLRHLCPLFLHNSYRKWHKQSEYQCHQQKRRHPRWILWLSDVCGQSRRRRCVCYFGRVYLLLSGGSLFRQLCISSIDSPPPLLKAISLPMKWYTVFRPTSNDSVWEGARPMLWSPVLIFARI